MSAVANRPVAVVTGASSGIGQATAIELAGRGYQVAVHYFSNEKGARDTFDQIRTVENHGERPEIVLRVCEFVTRFRLTARPSDSSNV